MVNYKKFHDIAFKILSQTFKPSEVDNALYNFANKQWSCRDLDFLEKSNIGFDKTVYKQFLEDYYSDMIY